MATTAQPAAGTSLHSDWTTGLVFARNEAETTESTLAAGSANRVDGTVSFSTDADGRYKTYGSSVERWDGMTFGPTMTMMVIVKYVSNGSNQALIDSDANPPRNWQWRINSDGTVQWIGFDGSENVDTNFASGNTVSTTDDVSIIVRVRLDGSTYKAKMWVGGTATSEQSYAGTPAAIGSTERIGITDRLGGSQTVASKQYFEAIWSSALSDTDCAALASNGWAIYDAKAGDSTPPVLTSPVGTTTGSTTATIGATTDEGNGTMYGVVTTSNTQPSVAQIAAGQDHTGSAAAFGGSVAVSSTGAKTINATGLTPSTAYYAHLYHDDAAGNDSNRVTSSQFTTDAAGGSGGGPLTRGLTRSPLIKGRCLA